MSPADSAEQPAASLLFFAYNHEAFVEQALLSALRQDVGPFELVVVDDASTDRTRAIMEAILARETPLGVTVRRLYKDTNAGLMAAVNDAMAMATGEIFMLMAGDDVSLPCRFARTLGIFTEYPSVQLVYGECQRIDESGRPYGPPSAGKERRFFSYDHFRLTRIYAESSPFGASAAYRRRLFDIFGPMITGDHGEDNCYWIRALLLGEICWDPAVLMHWRQHSGNLSNFKTQLNDHEWRRRHLDWMEKHAGISRQWLKDVSVAEDAGLVSWFRARRVTLAALREDRTWALMASSLRCAPWGEWLPRALRLLLVGRFSTAIKELLVRISHQRRERKWQFWAKLKSNPES